MTVIRTIKQLNENIDIDSGGEFFIRLNGLFRSSKTIWKIDKNKYKVLHEIDGTFENYTKQELLNSNIGEAMEKGGFFKY